MTQFKTQILRNIPKLSLFIGYHPKLFWDSWSWTFMDDPMQSNIYPQHKWILEKIRVTRPDSILEIGCGFGRNIKYFIKKGIDPKTIKGVDISPEMIKKARNYINNKAVKLYVADVSKLPFKDNFCDVTLSHGLFMHIKPDSIDNAVKEAFRVTRKALVVVEQNYLPRDQAKAYTFVHNYSNLFTKYGGKIREHIDNQEYGLSYFFVEVL